MEKLGGYILSVTAAAILAGILLSVLDQKSVSAALLKLIAGLFLTVAVIAPVARLDLSNLEDWTEPFSSGGEEAAAAGENMAQAAMADIIKSRTEAYILDKAEMYGAELTVEVTLRQTDGFPVPASVRLGGRVSPYAKAQLQSILAQELGISKESQRWIG